MTSETREPAPGALALVQAFVNTVDVEPHHEELDTANHLRDWLHDRSLLGDDEPVSANDLSRALAVREALRALLLANNGEEIDRDAVAALNGISADAALVVRFDPDGGAQLAPQARGVNGALGHLLAIVQTAMMQGTWARLKACRSHTCQWAFYDTSKNRSGAWCTMATCGSRSKARAYRQRRHSHAATA